MTRIGKNGHQRAFLVALVAIVGALVLSIVSFANTSTSSTVTIELGGVGGEFGFSVGQSTVASVDWSAGSPSTSTVTVSSVTNLSIGDYILIDENADGIPAGSTGDSYHTITDINGTTLTVDPEITNTYTTDADVFEQAPNAIGATWSPSVGSTSSVSAGNHFLVNLQGLGPTDAALIEIFLTNTDELVKNYTFLHRLLNIQVLCDSSVSCLQDNGSNLTPFSTSGTNELWQDAVDAAGVKVSETEDYLTLTNARQAFILLGGYTYALTIDGGTMFTIDVNTDNEGDSLSPTDLVQLTAL